MLKIKELLDGPALFMKVCSEAAQTGADTGRAT